MAGLLSLPIELLQQTASFLTCSSALNLLRVNHQLRNACNDRVVFQNIARRNFSYPPAGIFSTRSWSEKEFALASGSLDELVRLAYAAEIGAEAAFTEDNAWTLKISNRLNSLDISNWLPQMLVLGHSDVLQMKPETFLEVQGRSHPCNKNSVPERDFATINFIITYLLLHKIQYCIDASTIKEPLDHFFAENGHQTNGDSIDCLRQRVINYGEFKGYIDINQATALLPALILELATDDLSPLALDRLPAPNMIPFSSMLDVPALFQASADPLFSEEHIKKMANVDFLRGEWMGFFSDQSIGLHTRFFDAPMHDINIIAHAPSYETRRGERVTAIIERVTRGVDFHGEFSLQGWVGESGLVRVVKEYVVTRWSVSWLGRLTPFGIVGVWGDGEDDFGGHFWIWKREWCERGFDE